jgi:hypothetical protein
MAQTLVGCARSVLRLHKELKELESKIEKKKQAFQNAKECLLEMFQRNGLQSTSTKTHSLSLTRQIWASLRSKEVGIRVLKKHGLDWLIQEGINAQTLSAWVREQCPDETSMPKLPRELKQQIRVHEKFGISIRKR